MLKCTYFRSAFKKVESDQPQIADCTAVIETSDTLWQTREIPKCFMFGVLLLILTKTATQGYVKLCTFIDMCEANRA